MPSDARCRDESRRTEQRKRWVRRARREAVRRRRCSGDSEGRVGGAEGADTELARRSGARRGRCAGSVQRESCRGHEWSAETGQVWVRIGAQARAVGACECACAWIESVVCASAAEWRRSGAMRGGGRRRRGETRSRLLCTPAQARPGPRAMGRRRLAGARARAAVALAPPMHGRPSRSHAAARSHAPLRRPISLSRLQPLHPAARTITQSNRIRSMHCLVYGVARYIKRWRHPKLAPATAPTLPPATVQRGAASPRRLGPAQGPRAAAPRQARRRDVHCPSRRCCAAAWPPAPRAARCRTGPPERRCTCPRRCQSPRPRAGLGRRPALGRAGMSVSSEAIAPVRRGSTLTKSYT